MLFRLSLPRCPPLWANPKGAGSEKHSVHLLFELFGDLLIIAYPEIGQLAV